MLLCLSVVEFDIQGEVARDGGAKVREVLDYLECEVTDGDAWGAAHVLAYDVGLQADSQAKLSTRTGEAFDKSLKHLLGVGRQSCII